MRFNRDRYNPHHHISIPVQLAESFPMLQADSHGEGEPRERRTLKMLSIRHTVTFWTSLLGRCECQFDQ